MSIELADKEYIGIVVNNDDPLRIGRIKCRVLDVFENMPDEFIPWASQTHDIAGQQFSVPDIGKIVSVNFENGCIYTPVYTYAQHFNINLENKLKSLSYDDYMSMTAMQFDDRTQVYVNHSEGLKLDHMYNTINITEDGINLNAKDNSARVNLGTYDANQQAILGNNFLEFIDELLNLFSTNAFIGNLMSPVLPSPQLVQLIAKYQANKDPKYLSKNVYLNDNGYVNKLERPSIAQVGDKWTSTADENKITTIQQTSFSSINTTPDSTPSGKQSIGIDINTSPQTPPEREVNPDIKSLLGVLKDKKYKIYTKPYELNMIGVRYQYVGQDYSNKFIDKLYFIWKDDNNEWNIKWWKMSTIPGLNTKIKNDDVQKGFPKEKLGKKVRLKEWCSYFRKQGLGILAPCQMVNIYTIGEFINEFAFKARGKQLVYRDRNFNDDTISFSTSAKEEYVGMHIHKAFPNGTTVDNYSEGCQVISSKNDLSAIETLAKKHASIHGNSFTYTLITSNDVDTWKRNNPELV